MKENGKSKIKGTIVEKGKNERDRESGVMNENNVSVYLGIDTIQYRIGRSLPQVFASGYDAIALTGSKVPGYR